MDIKLGTTFTLFQAGRKRLNPSYFLCVFRDVDANEIRQAITQSLGDSVGPLLLELTEGTSDPINGVVQLYSGDWVLTVYEQTSSTNLDASNANRTVWSELVRVSAQCDADPGPQPYDPCDGCPGGGTLCEEVEDSTPAEIVACIAEADKTEAVQALICDPCDPTTVNGVESDTPTITVLQGGNPVGTLNPETGVVTIDECPPPEPCEPLKVTVNGETALAVENPCDETAALTVVDSEGDPVTVTVLEGVITVPALPCAPGGFDVLRIQFQPYANEARYDFTAVDAGTYDNPTNDGGSGTITYSINGGAFGAWPGATAFVNGNNIRIRRTTATALGWVQIEQ